jgi:hypothetical protein
LPEVVAEWIAFRDNIAPQDDDAVRFMETRGMYVPLKEELFGDTNSIVGPAEPPVNSLDGRERVKFTASVQWSGRGRMSNTSSSNVPYVSVDSSGATVAPITYMQAPRRRRASRFEAKTAGTDSDSDSDSSEDVPTFEYVDVDVSSGVSRDFFKYIGREFDDSQDGGSFRIVGICEMHRIGTRKSSNIVCVFKYVDTNGDAEDFLYTPIGEMLSCSWCKWKSDTTTSGRSTRLLKRTQNESNSEVSQKKSK